MLQITFEWVEFGLERFESLSNGSNLHSNASNLFRMIRIWIRILQIPFESFEFAFECFESLSNGLNLGCNSLNFDSKGWNLDLNASNPFQMVQICIRMLRRMGRNCSRILRIPLERFKFRFESSNLF